MKIKLVLLFLIASALSAFAQTLPAGAPPSPVGPAVICNTCYASFAASTTSIQAIQLPASIPPYNAITIRNNGPNDAWFALGNSTIQATQSNPVIRAGQSLTVSVANTGGFFDAITIVGSATIDIYQGNASALIGSAGASGGTANLASVSSLRSGNFSNISSGIANLSSYYGNDYYGGGTFSLGGSNCNGVTTDNGGNVIQDIKGNLWCRQQSGVTLDATQWGAYCDGVTTVFGGTMNAGSNQFTITSGPVPTNVSGMYLQVWAAGGVNPWITPITSVSGNVLTTQYNAPNSYPGTSTATDATFNGPDRNGIDSPGTGYGLGDTLTATGGVFTVAATATVNRVGLVAITQTSGGSNYHVNDLISLTASNSSSKTPNAAVVQVTAVDNSCGTGCGAITATQIITNGLYSSSTNTMPSSFIQTGGHGHGFTFTLAANNGSFGIGRVVLGVHGAYSSPPPFPTGVTDNNNPSASGGTIELTIKTAEYSLFHDDTTALNNLEAYAETSNIRGVYSSISIPSGKKCFLNSLVINYPVAWSSGGSRNGTLQMILGSPGASVNGSNVGFIVVATGQPTADAYAASNTGQYQPSFQNIVIAGSSQSTTYDTGSFTGITTSTDCVVFANPTRSHSNVAAILYNVQVLHCPGNGISANVWGGELIGYNLFISQHGGNCIDLQNIANPTRLYRVIGSDCGIGANLVSVNGFSIHGGGLFGTRTVDMSVTGSIRANNSMIMLYDMALGGSQDENFYDDAQNETIYCIMCHPNQSNKGNASSGINDSDIAIGPDAVAAGPGQTPVLVLDDTPLTSAYSDNNIYFASSPVGSLCLCTVLVGGATRNVDTGNITTNSTGNITGPQYSFSPTIPTYKVANLPSATNGMMAGVTDASTSCTAGSAPTGGGSNFCVVVYNGSWKETGF